MVTNLVAYSQTSGCERTEENVNRICDCAGRLVPKVAFGRGPAMTPEERNGRIAMLGASLLTLVAVSWASLGLWRVGTDLEWAGDFFIQEGFLSHWQVWIGAAVGAEYTSWRLTRYAAIARAPGAGRVRVIDVPRELAVNEIAVRNDPVLESI